MSSSLAAFSTSVAPAPICSETLAMDDAVDARTSRVAAKREERIARKADEVSRRVNRVLVDFARSAISEENSVEEGGSST
jgi:hypothetical protein